MVLSLAGTGQLYTPIDITTMESWGLLWIRLDMRGLHIAEQCRVSDLTYYLFFAQREALYRDDTLSDMYPTVSCQVRLYPNTLHIQCVHRNLGLKANLKAARAPFFREGYFVQDIPRERAPVLTALLLRLEESSEADWLNVF